MAGPLISRLPQPSGQELRKLNVTGYTTKMIQATLASATQIPRITKKPKASLRDRQSNTKPTSKPREEIYAPGYLTHDQIRFGILCSMNPDIDRGAAVVGHVDEAKLSIVLYKPPFGAAGEPLRLKYFTEIHWDRESNIRSLNRWRESIFRHYLGLGLLQASDWHQLEKDFVAEACKARQDQANSRASAKKKFAHGQVGKISWAAIAQDFNARFSGRKLPGCEEPRPTRKRTDLIVQNCRMQKDTGPFLSTPFDGQGPIQRRQSPALSPRASAIPRLGSNVALKQPTGPNVGPSSIPKLVQKTASSTF